MRIDCDQDAVWIKVEQAGAGACHTGRRSCFYRAVPLGKAPDGSLTLATCADATKAKSYVGCDYWPTVTGNNV